MSGEDQAKFEGWAVVEVFGHQKYAGLVTSQAFGGTVLFRVDVPDLPARERMLKYREYVGTTTSPAGTKIEEQAVQGYTKLFGAGAIYAITPCTEEFAVKAVEEMTPRKMRVLEIPVERAAITSAAVVDVDADPDDGSQEADEEEDGYENEDTENGGPF